MRIGSFFGQTAPMLVIESDPKFAGLDRATIEDVALLVCRSFTSHDVAVEFTALKRALNRLSIEVTTDVSLYTEENPEAVYENGKILGSDSSEDASSFELSFAFLLASRVVQDARAGTFYDLGLEGLEVREIRTRVIEIAKRALTGRVTVRGLKRLVASTIKQFRSDKPTDLNKLKTAFRMEVKLADRFSTSNGFLKPSDDTMKILQYYIDNYNRIEELERSVVLKAPEEIKVFDVPFSSLIRRKPISLFYMTIQFFEYTKNKHNAYALQRVRSMVQENLLLLQKLKKERVYLKGETDSEQFLDAAHFDEVLLTYGQQKANFFRVLRNAELLDTNFIPVVTVQLISEVYDAVSKVTRENLIKFFKLSDSVDLDQVNKELLALGVCGFNSRCLDLFAKAITSTILYFDNRVMLTPQDAEEIDEKIADVQALLDSLIPIGEDLTWT